MTGVEAGNDLLLEATPARLPLRSPFRTSRAVQEHAEVVRVAVRCGHTVGFGESAPQPENGETTESVLETLDACGRLLGDDPLASEAIEARTRHLRSQSAALAGLDAALHDLRGKLLGLPTWRLLGLSNRGAPSCISLSLEDAGAMAKAASACIRRQPRLERLKLKLAGDGRDLERVSAVRAVTSVPLVVDANAAWTIDQALTLLPELAALGVELVEQPLAPGDDDAVRLKAKSPLPLIADEECRGVEDVAAVSTRAHGINVKVTECGGVRNALRMIQTARALGLRVMIGCMIESSLGIAAALQLSSLADVVDLDGNLYLESDPWTGVEWADGRPAPSSAPGLGVRPRGSAEVALP